MFSMAMWMATIVAPIQLVAGDMHGLNTLQHQPAKIAAMEGHFETQRGAPLLLFGWPDMEAERTRYAVGIPHLGSLVLTHEWNGEIKGLKDFPKEDRPNATIVFWSFRVMVGIGVLMIGLGLLGLLQRLRRKLYESRALLWLTGHAEYDDAHPREAFELIKITVRDDEAERAKVASATRRSLELFRRGFDASFRGPVSP